MVFGLFNHKKRLNKLRNEVQDSFSHVKKDVNKIGDWIKHLDEKKKNHDKDIEGILKSIEELNKDVKEIKESIQFLGQPMSKQENKHPQVLKNTQQTAFTRQTAVQTTVQTEDLERLTVMERVVVWSLLNTDMKLSYEDIAALLGKDKSTVRGQINTIKQKIPYLIEEQKEPNGKKRIYITEENKKKITKKANISVKPEK